MQGEDADTTAKGLSQKNMALRSKPGSTKTSVSSAKNSKNLTSSVTLTIEELAEDVPIVPSIDNLPPSITEVGVERVVYLQ